MSAIASTFPGWEIVIGLEIHCRLDTCSKLFSGAPNQYGAEVNTQACPLDLALPGTLPVINRRAVELAIRFGLAINARIADRCVFARKNYFYPDLPKGYQISQFEQPVVAGGHLTIETANGATKRIGITRAHLEEDAGKSVHDQFPNYTGIDLNRAGTPLIEIVSEPDMRSADEAMRYMRSIHEIVRYLEISDGNMQEGSFRCDANISVRLAGEQRLGTRTELKNINSFRYVGKAIEHEAQRQIDLIEDGKAVAQETRLYDPIKNQTRSMRSKEDAHDYRYFPDPDLPTIQIDPAWIQEVRTAMPELPEAKRLRFIRDYGLNDDDSLALTSTKETANYFETCVQTGGNAKLCANWITGELAAALNKEQREIAENPVSAVMLGELIAHIANGKISGTIGRQVFEAMWHGEGRAIEIISKRGLEQVSDDAQLHRWVRSAIDSNPEQVQQYRCNPPEKRKKLIGYFVGQIMKLSKGKANPRQINALLLKELE
ncbi:MAG: Asp-tRNA(Asn)/Glu-tRNA(Gln) amidotransferase subunit GatB [Candidatus Eutrophobiaceae bacterium]